MVSLSLSFIFRFDYSIGFISYNHSYSFIIRSASDTSGTVPHSYQSRPLTLPHIFALPSFRYQCLVACRVLFSLVIPEYCRPPPSGLSQNSDTGSRYRSVCSDHSEIILHMFGKIGNFDITIVMLYRISVRGIFLVRVIEAHWIVTTLSGSVHQAIRLVDIYDSLLNVPM